MSQHAHKKPLPQAHSNLVSPGSFSYLFPYSLWWKLLSLTALNVQMEIKDDEDSSSNGHVRLVEDALKEALACPAGQAFKPFIAALLKLANGLSLDGATQASPCAFPGSCSNNKSNALDYFGAIQGASHHTACDCDPAAALSLVHSSSLLCFCRLHILTRALFQG